MYQPALKPHHIRALFRLKETFRKPMTKIVEEILNEAFRKFNSEDICRVCREEGNDSECPVCPFNPDGNSERR